MTKKKSVEINFTLHHPQNIYEGFLRKKGKNLINRTPLRYVVIRRDAIYYFDTKKDEKNGQEQPDLTNCLGYIKIKQVQNLQPDESESKVTITSYSETKRKSKAFVFYMDNKDQFIQWTEKFKGWFGNKSLYSLGSAGSSVVSTFSSEASTVVSAKGGNENTTTSALNVPKGGGRKRSQVLSSTASPSLSFSTSSTISEIHLPTTSSVGMIGERKPTAIDDDEVTSYDNDSSDEEDSENGKTTNNKRSDSLGSSSSLLNQQDEVSSTSSGGRKRGTQVKAVNTSSFNKALDKLGSNLGLDSPNTRQSLIKAIAKDNGLDAISDVISMASSVADTTSVTTDMEDEASSTSSAIVERYAKNKGKEKKEDKFDKRRFHNIMTIFPIEKEQSKYLDDGKRVDLKKPIDEVMEWEQELIKYELDKQQQMEKDSGKVQQVLISSLTPHDYASAQEKFKETLKQEDKVCYWSHEILWQNTKSVGKNQLKEALLVVGNRNLFIVDPRSFKTETKVRIADIYHIVQSGYEDEIVGIIRKDREEQTDILIHFTETKKSRDEDNTHVSMEDEVRVRGSSFASSITDGHKELETEVYLKKVEFFDYISQIYEKQRGNKLKIYFVNDVKLVTRTMFREDPYELNERLILESNAILQIDKKHDYIKLYQEPMRCRVMSEFGDKNVFFAALLAKKNKRNKYQNRTVIVTDKALYVFDPKKQKAFKRRIKLSEISKVYRNKKKGCLIDVPSEYPLCLVPKQNMEVFEDFINVLASLYYDNDFLQNLRDVEFDSFDLEKSQGFKEKMTETEDILYVQTQLRNAISNKDVNNVREYLAYADTLVNKRDAQETHGLRELRLQASEFLGDIRLQEFIRDKLQRAFNNRDFLEMQRMLEHVENLKKERGESELYKPLVDYLNSISTEKNVVVNKHLIMTKIQQLIESGVDTENEKRILHVIDIAKRAGFVKEVEKYKQMYDRQKQTLNLEQQLDEIIQRKKNNTNFDSDADRLIAIIENAKELGIYQGKGHEKTKFQKAFEEHTKDFITNKSNNYNFKQVIEQTKKDIETNFTKLKREIEKVKTGSEGYTNIDKHLVDEAEKTIVEIEDIRKYQKKMKSILDKTEKKQLKLEEAQDLIERCKKKLNQKRKGFGETKEYRELMKRANNTHNDVKRELKKLYKQEATKIASTLRKLLEQKDFDTLKLKLDEIIKVDIKPLLSEFPDLQKTIDEVSDTLNTIDFLKKLANVQNVEEEYSYKDVEKVIKFKDFAERNPDSLGDRERESLQKIERKVVYEFKLYNEIQEQKRRLKNLEDSVNYERMELLLEEVSNVASLQKEVNDLNSVLRRKKLFDNYVREIIKRRASNRSYDDIFRKASKEDFDLDLLLNIALSTKHSDETDIENEINELVKNKDAKGLQEIINRYSDTMSKSLLKLANSKLNHLRRQNMTPQELVDQLNNAVDLRDKDELITGIELGEKMLDEETISEHSKLQIQFILEKAKKLLKEIINTENIETIKSLPQEFIEDEFTDDELDLDDDNPYELAQQLRNVNGLMDYTQMTKEEKQKYLFEVFQSKSIYTDSELLQRLTFHVNKLRAFCEARDETDYNEEEEKYLIERDNVFGQNVIKVLVDILNHKTKKRFFSSAKDPYEILSGLKRNDDYIVKLVDTFEVNDLIKKLKKEKKMDQLSSLFIYFLLSEKAFMYVIEKLLTSEDYLNECYELDAILLDRRYRDEFYPLISLLAMFTFSYNLTSATDVLAVSPVSKLKGILRAIIHYYYSHVDSNNQHNIFVIGNEERSPKLGELIRMKLIPTLMEIFMHKLKSSLFSKYHIWQFIQEVVEQKRISALDIGGINLPIAFDTINNQLNCSLDLKFEYFICYSLNRGYLAEFFETIVKDRVFLKKYYEEFAFILDKDVIANTMKYLEVLTTLPFNLREQPITEPIQQ
ncbi:hypothetical protein ABK040_000321 [Willaertia magna]